MGCLLLILFSKIFIITTFKIVFFYESFTFLNNSFSGPSIALISSDSLLKRRKSFMGERTKINPTRHFDAFLQSKRETSPTPIQVENRSENNVALEIKIKSELRRLNLLPSQKNPLVPPLYSREALLNRTLQISGRRNGHAESIIREGGETAEAKRYAGLSNPGLPLKPAGSPDKVFKGVPVYQGNPILDTSPGKLLPVKRSWSLH
jgi:hypothetical protein